MRAARSSPFSEMFGLIEPLIRSWLMAEEMASSRPAAVDRAAARPPAATRAMTQPGRAAISGFARTMMSLSTLVSSLPTKPQFGQGLVAELALRPGQRVACGRWPRSRQLRSGCLVGIGGRIGQRLRRSSQVPCWHRPRPCGSLKYWIRPSPFLSAKSRRPVAFPGVDPGQFRLAVDVSQRQAPAPTAPCRSRHRARRWWSGSDAPSRQRPERRCRAAR